MAQQVEINSLNFSGEQVTVVFTPTGSDVSYGLGVKTIPFIFDTSTIDDSLSANGTYTFNLLDTNCSYILVI